MIRNCGIFLPLKYNLLPLRHPISLLLGLQTDFRLARFIHEDVLELLGSIQNAAHVNAASVVGRRIQVEIIIFMEICEEI